MNYYEKRVEEILEYIENNIENSDLSLNKLASLVGFSPYHFHRIFHAVTGESLHKYILECKLNRCAGKLLYEDCDITKIALDYGFATSSSFSKSFKQQFKCTPSQYKKIKDRSYPAAFANISFQKFLYNSDIEKYFSKVKLPNIKAVCLGVTGLSENWENLEIEKAYKQIFAWLSENRKYTKNTKICGITLDSPEVRPLSSCRYYACATVEDYVQDDQLSFRSFETEGTYICCRIERSIKNFASSFFQYMDYLYGFYMVSHNVSPDSRPFVEFYEKGAKEKLFINFCVPVKNNA